MIDPQDYNISVRRGEFEGEVCFEARVKELPDLAEYGDTFEEAYGLAVDAIDTTAEVFAEKGKPMPRPLAVSGDYSGRVTLRLPKTLHRALAESAEDQGVSLNQYLVNILAYFSGFAAGAGHTPESVDYWKTFNRTPSRKTSPTSNLRLVSSAKLHEGEEWQEAG